MADGKLSSNQGNVNILAVSAGACALDPHSTGSNSLTDPSGCVCQSGYDFRMGYCMRVNCSSLSLVNNSAGNNLAPTTCNCTEGYVWDNRTLMCVRNCPTVAHSTSLNYEPGDCVCQSGYTWNVNECIVYVDCQNLPYSTGRNLDSNTCGCVPDYVYNLSLRSCVKNCTAVVNNAGVNVSNISQCICNPGYVYNTSLCGVDGAYCLRNCTKLTAPWVRGIDCADPTQCRCYDSFDWNVSNSKCDLNCTRINYSTGSTRKNGSCKCKGGYQFDLAIYRCTSGTSDSAAVAIAVGIAVPLAVAGAVGLYFWLQYRKKKKQKKERLEHPSAQSATYVNLPPAATTTTTIQHTETRIPVPPISSSRSMAASQPIVFRESRHMGVYAVPPPHPLPAPMPAIAGPAQQVRPMVIGGPVIGAPVIGVPLSGSGISSSPGNITPIRY